MSALPNIPSNLDAGFATDMAAALREQAKSIRASSDAGYETISYSVRRGGIAGFFGSKKDVTEKRLKPGAQQLLDNAAMLDQQAMYYDSLAKSLGNQKSREDALAKSASDEELKKLGAQKGINEGGNQYTRNELTINPGLAIALGFGNQDSPGAMSGIRIPTGS